MNPKPPDIPPEWTPPASALGGRFTLVQLMLLVGACALLVRLALVTGGLIVAFAIVVLPAMAIALAVAMAGRLEAERDALLWALATAAGRGMPLGPAVEAVADQFGGRSRRVASALAWWLDSGASLAEALERVPVSMPAPAAALIRVGSATDLLPAALREAVDARAARPPARDAVRSRIAYLCVVLLVIQGQGGFLAFFVLPKLEAIAGDFGVGLPDATLFVISAGRALVESLALPLLMLGEVATLLYLFLAATGLVRGRLPLPGRLARRRHVGAILRALAVVVEGDRPLAAGIGALAASYPDPWVRRRLEQAGLWVGQGADAWTALRGAGLLDPREEMLLAAAQRAGNLPWALREVAEGGERRLADRLQAWSQILFAAAILAIGGLVFLLVAAYFTPIITLIEGML